VIPLFALMAVAFLALIVCFGMAAFEDRPSMAFICLLVAWLALWVLLDMAGLRLVSNA
jgi:hypothetical protein